MKKVLLPLVTLGLLSCYNAERPHPLQERIDFLEHKLSETYTPGFGEFMSSIQTHHSKLWFAGKNGNWKLADFEAHEIMEAVDDIQKFHGDRKESRTIEMIKPVLENINDAIQQKDPALFESGYSVLTNTCNKCHRATSYEFNVIKIPDTPPFGNQDFKIKGSFNPLH